MKTRYFLGLALLTSAIAIACSDGGDDESTPQDTVGDDAGSSNDASDGDGDGGTIDDDASDGEGGPIDDGGDGEGGTIEDDGGDGEGGVDDDAGDGGDDGPFASATEVIIDGPAILTALSDAGTPGYFRFEGNAGDRIVIVTSAQKLANTNGDDPTVIDTVVTLYDSEKNLLARNDDPFPRTGRDAELYTVLPRDGVYYFTVSDCNAVFTACSPATDIETFAYEVKVLRTSQLPETTATSANDGIANAATIVYGTKDDANVYQPALISGVFDSPNQTHVFAFTPPDDAAVLGGHRYRVDFFVQPVGKELGNGSDANVKVRVTDATGTVVHASAEQVHHGDGRDLDNPPLDVSVPLTPGQTYYLFVENDGGSGANGASFYFIHHYVGTYWYGFAEEEGPTNSGHNDSLASSEYSQSFDGLPNVYFYDGNLPGGTDVDWFYLESSGSNNVTIQCHAQRAGSGLRNFKAELLNRTLASPRSLICRKRSSRRPSPPHCSRP